MNVSTKFLISLPAIALMTACTSSGVSNSTVFGADSIPNTYEKRSSHDTQVMTPVNYTCSYNGSITVDYANSSVVRMKVSFPGLKLQNQPLNLYRKVSSSGALYVNELNPDSTIGWQTQGEDAVFAVQWRNGRHYKANCMVK